MSFFDSISSFLGTDKDTGLLGGVGKSIGLDNDTIKGLRLPALAAGAYFGAPYLAQYFGGGGAAAADTATGGAFNFSPIDGTGSLFDGSALGGLGSAVAGNSGLGMALGGLLGAASGGDTTTSAQKDPWAPAQPYLKANLMQNALMQDHYSKNPFTDEQKSAYQGAANTLANNQANGPAMQGMANSFMNSKGGNFTGMPSFTSGTTAAPIDWTKYSNIGLLKG